MGIRIVERFDMGGEPTNSPQNKEIQMKNTTKPSAVTPSTEMRRRIAVQYAGGTRRQRMAISRRWSRGIIRRSLREMAIACADSRGADALLSIRASV
jgi:hypothetical protein